MDDIKHLFCQRFACPEARFRQEMLRLTLYRHARMFAPALRWMLPHLFAEDEDFLDRVGRARDPGTVRVEALLFREDAREYGGLLRNKLRLRVSGRKVIHVTSGLLKQAAGGQTS